MQGVPAKIIDQQVEHVRRADPAYGEGAKRAVKQTHTPPASAPTTAADAVGQAAA
jgi:catalase